MMFLLSYTNKLGGLANRKSPKQVTALRPASEPKMSKGNESVKMQEFSMVDPTFRLTRETHTRAASPTAQRSNTPNSSSGRFLPRNSWAVLKTQYFVNNSWRSGSHNW